MKTVGYYSSWAAYKTCRIKEIDPSLCDILIYAFAGLNADGTIKVLDDWANIQQKGYKKFNKLKTKNSRLKTLLAVGGWNEGSLNYSNMAKTQASRKMFIQSCVEVIEEYGFNGIDLDWEYPGQNGGSPEDKENLALLVKEVRKKFDKYGYIFTMAVGVGEATINISYDIPALSKYLDYILVMAYDFHSHSNGRTGENAPLTGNNHNNVKNCIDLWISKGANPKKLVLGIGAYGQSYTLTDSSNHRIGAPTMGPGYPGPISEAAGTLHYSEILLFERHGYKKKWSNEQQVPFMYKDNQWVGYDDTDSVKLKVTFAKKRKLGGIMVWAIDMDDPRGESGPKYPILNAIVNG